MLPEYTQDSFSLAPLGYLLLGYLVLQIGLNIVNADYVKRNPDIQSLVTATFWSTVVNALFFLIAAVLYHIWELAPNAKEPPANLRWWGLAGVPLGILLWYLSVQARKLGMALFGKSDILAAEDAILRYPPSAQYISWGVINLSIIQPLGRELFLRGVFLPVAVLNVGWVWAFVSVLIVELLMRLNIVWMPVTVLYTIFMVGLFYLSGNAFCGLVAACIAGLVHGIALAYMTMSAQTKKNEEELVKNVKE